MINYININNIKNEMFKMRKPRENHDIVKDLETDKNLTTETVEKRREKNT